jgi:hypothetical protein
VKKAGAMVRQMRYLNKIFWLVCGVLLGIIGEGVAGIE